MRELVITGVIAATAPACGHQALQPVAGDHVSISPGASHDAAKSFPGKFTGDATVTMFLSPTKTLAASGALVAFAPGGRTAWHSHPAGQTLFITSGTGWVQEWGGKKLEVEPGDIVWTPPGVKHWHGGTTSSAMAHVAIQGFVDDTNVVWMEPVTDAQYAQ